MMYKNMMVCCLKANGKILREFKDTVYIPFSSEYQVSLKNLNTQRALLNIYIDGQDIVEGGLVLNAGQEIDLERFVKNGNMTAGNKLKFIERTKSIEDGPRGIKLEDGLIRIEFQYEKEVKPLWANTIMRGSPVHDTHIYPQRFDKIYTTNVNGQPRRIDVSNGMATAQAASDKIDHYFATNGIQCSASLHDGCATMDSYSTASASIPKNDIGITVAGSHSSQKFTTVTMGEMETEKHVLVLKILGETPDNKPVTEAVTTKHKPKCTTCGKMNKAASKFCAECGTALTIY